MALELLAIDLGKRSFHLYGIDTDGVIVSRKVSRAKHQRQSLWKRAPTHIIGLAAGSPPAAKCVLSIPVS
jgi:hypothetical protein